MDPLEIVDLMTEAAMYELRLWYSVLVLLIQHVLGSRTDLYPRIILLGDTSELIENQITLDLKPKKANYPHTKYRLRLGSKSSWT